MRAIKLMGLIRGIMVMASEWIWVGWTPPELNKKQHNIKGKSIKK